MSLLDVNKVYSPEEIGMGKGSDSLLPVVSKPVLPEPPSPPGSASDVQGDSSVSVYVRVRPLLEDETKSGVGLLPGMITSTSDPDNTSATAVNTDKTSIGGFTGVLGTDANNEMLFKRCFKPQLDTVLAGGTASLFCYGYTGSGKSHTVLGYDGERGLYHLAAGDLLARMQEKYPGELIPPC